jgi:hypothetical protein
MLVDPNLLWRIASSGDLEWIRQFIDPKWLRIRLLIDTLGPDAKINISKLARDPGIKRNKATQWVQEIRAEHRARTRQ